MGLPLEIVQIELLEHKASIEETRHMLIISINSTDSNSHFVHACLVDVTICDTRDASAALSIVFDKQPTNPQSRNVGANEKQIAPTRFCFDLSESQFCHLKNDCHKLKIRLAVGKPLQEKSICTLEFELRNGHYYKEQFP